MKQQKVLAKQGRVTKKGKPIKKSKSEKDPFFSFVDKSTARVATVINSKEAKKVVQTVTPALKQMEDNRHKEAMKNAKGSGGGLFGDLLSGLGMDSSMISLLSNPYVLGGLVSVGGLVAIKVAL